MCTCMDGGGVSCVCVLCWHWVMLGGDNVISLAVLTEARYCDAFNYEEIHKSFVTNTKAFHS